jgi:Kdo2-lipid IVA lauroyltransferase/acyltransferase
MLVAGALGASELSGSRKRKKWLKRGPGAWAAWVGLAIYYVVLLLLPIAWLMPVGRGVGRFMHRFMGRRRRIALANLRMALGDQTTPAGRRRILFSLMQGLGVTLAELGPSGYLHRDTLRRYVAFQGLEHLQEALSRGKGAILVTAHFGNFPLMLAKLGLEGYPVGVIIRDPRHRPVARYLDRWRARYGVATVKDKPRWASVKKALGLLQSNGVLVVHIDVNVSDGGAFVPFFGQWVPTFRGPALLSLRTGAPLLPTFIRRIHGIHHRICIQPPLVIQSCGDREEDSWRLLWGLTRSAEAAIRENPDHWWWMHRRFRKARPEEEVGRPLPVG